MQTASGSGATDEISVPWLIGTARHKLIDHWPKAAFRHVSAERSRAEREEQSHV